MSPPQMTTSNQGIPRNRQEMPQLTSMVSKVKTTMIYFIYNICLQAQIESNPAIRASSFMVDPLIIIGKNL